MISNNHIKETIKELFEYNMVVIWAGNKINFELDNINPHITFNHQKLFFNGTSDTRIIFAPSLLITNSYRYKFYYSIFDAFEEFLIENKINATIELHGDSLCSSSTIKNIEFNCYCCCHEDYDENSDYGSYDDD